MKILAVTGVIDLQSRMGCVAQWWALLKSVHEAGNDVILMSYLGDSIESPHWKAYPNPCNLESKLANWFLNKTGIRNVHGGSSQFMVDNYIKPKWERALINVIAKEKIEAVVFMTLPIKHFEGIPTLIHQKFNIPVLFYDGDLPSSLPKYGTKSFKFGTYGINSLKEFDAIISNSEGCIDDLKQIGARKVAVAHFAADPSVFSPVKPTHHYADIFYYGHRVAGKENRFKYMVIEPSKQIDCLFVVGGRENGSNIGTCERRGVLSLSEWRTECCNSKINVNVTKDVHAEVYASSNARIFELAMLGCCVVTDKYNGLEQWFEAGKEMMVAQDTGEAVYLYRWLLSNEKIRLKMGESARQRALSCHTFTQRAEELMNVIKSL